MTAISRSARSVTGDVVSSVKLAPRRDGSSATNRSLSGSRASCRSRGEPPAEGRPHPYLRAAARDQPDVAALDDDLLLVGAADQTDEITRRSIGRDVIVLGEQMHERHAN